MTKQEIMLIGRNYSMTNGTNLMATIDAIEYLDQGIAGDIVECGVWQGGHTIAAMLAAKTDRTYWLFDTFDGMTEPGPEDTRNGSHATESTKYRKGGARNWCRCEIDQVRRNVDAWRRPEQQARYCVGPVEETLTQRDLPREIAFLRLDTDFYSSTKIELEVLWPRVVSGGIMIVDDYGSWDGCRRAVHEYFSNDMVFDRVSEKSIKITKS